MPTQHLKRRRKQRAGPPPTACRWRSSTHPPAHSGVPRGYVQGARSADVARATNPASWEPVQHAQSGAPYSERAHSCACLLGRRERVPLHVEGRGPLNLEQNHAALAVTRGPSETRRRGRARRGRSPDGPVRDDSYRLACRVKRALDDGHRAGLRARANAAQELVHVERVEQTATAVVPETHDAVRAARDWARASEARTNTRQATDRRGTTACP
jgi:hypothetical protein